MADLLHFSPQAESMRSREIDKNDFFKQKASFEKIKFLLRYAVLAPSTHNSQPWLFKVEKNSCKIYSNPEKNITEADPLGRDLHISFGCLIENLIVAADYFSIFSHLEYFGGREDYLIAEVFFQNLDAPPKVKPELEKILDAIPKRVNARGIFEKKSISQEIVQKIVSKNDFSDLRIDIVQQPEKIDALARLTAEGLKMAYSHTSFRKEMSSWMNSSFSRRKEGIPGYSLRMPPLVSLVLPTLMRLFNMSRRVAFLNYQSISSAPVVCVISAEKNSPAIWLMVGRLFERIALTIGPSGLKASIFVASVEMGDLYKDVQKILDHERIPQFLFCLGYMDFNQAPNMRHQVESKIIS